MSLAPQPGRDWALFLDIDGTLLDIAERPEKVVVPETLSSSLLTASNFLGGALALVSGRTLEDIDRLLEPIRLPCAAEHGAVLRLSDGSLQSFGPDHRVPADLRASIRAAAAAWPGSLVEEKRFNVVIHFRQAPQHEAAIGEFVSGVASRLDSDFEVLHARMAFEIRHRGIDKGAAVRTFMQKVPFASRKPVFVGDDVTDQDGFDAALAMGGLALDVRTVFANAPIEVRRWLERFSRK